MPERSTAAEPDALERELYERPDDLEAWAVHADALAARGDARGELIQLELLLEAGVSLAQRSLTSRYAALMTDERPRWIEPALLELLDEPDLSRTCLIEWRRGYLDSVSLLGPGATGLGPRLATLLGSPSAAMLHALALSIDADRHDLDTLGHAQLGVHRLDSLRRLDIDAWTFRRGERPPLVDLRFDWQQSWPRLEQLRVKAVHVALGSIRHARLVDLRLSTRHGVELEPLRALARAELPRLRRLALYLGRSAELDHDDDDAYDDDERDARASPARMRALGEVLGDIFTMAGACGLTHLGLILCDQPALLLTRLGEAPELLATLEHLDLGYGLLGAEHVEPLLGVLRRCPRLRALDLDWNYLPSEAVVAIEAGLPGVAVRSETQKNDRGPDTRELPVFGRYGVAEDRGYW